MTSRFARFTRRMFGSRPAPEAPARRQNVAPQFVQLEDRTVPATFVVTNILDNQADAVGGLSLRQAINAANANPGFDQIIFNIPRSPSLPTLPNNPSENYFPIVLATTLPDLTDPAGVMIDATTQPRVTQYISSEIGPDGSLVQVGPNDPRNLQATRPIIQLLPDPNPGAFSGQKGAFFMTGGNNVIRGFVITGFPGSAINIVGSSANNNVVVGNWINTDITGTKSWNQDPILLSARPANTPAELTNAGPLSGQQDVEANPLFVISGVAITGGASNNVIGGTTDAEGRPLLSAGGDLIGQGGSIFRVTGANSSTGIPITPTTNRNIISGTPEFRKDYIVYYVNGSKYLSTFSRTVRERDLLGSAVGPGIRIQDQGTSRNLVQGNYIGTDFTGTSAIANVNGIEIFNAASDNFIGNPVTPVDPNVGPVETGVGNLIRFNQLDGIRIANHPNPSQGTPRKLGASDTIPLNEGYTSQNYSASAQYGPFQDFFALNNLFQPELGIIRDNNGVAVQELGAVFFDSFNPNYFEGGAPGGGDILTLGSTDPSNPIISNPNSFSFNASQIPNTNPGGEMQVGTTFVLNGSGLLGTTGVSFLQNASTGEEISARFRVLNDTSVEVTVPNGAVTGPVKLFTPSGVARTSTSVVILPSPSPQLDVASTFFPSAGPIGSLVTINGTGFLGTTQVVFNGQPATKFQVLNNGTQIQAFVPVGAKTGLITVINTVGQSVTTRNFQVLASPPPQVNAVSVGSAVPGQTVTLTGIGFTGAFLVRFGVAGGSSGIGTTDFTIDSDTQITVKVPSGPASLGQIQVQAANGTGLSAFTFQTLTPPTPTITSLSATQGPAGTVLTLNGTGFTSVTSGSFGSISATSTKVISDTQLQLTVPPLVQGPSGASVTAPVRVTTAAGTVSGPNFTVTASPAPGVDFFVNSVPAARQNTTVVITGKGLTGTSNVLFGSSIPSIGTPSPSIQVVSDTEIRVLVPVGASTGPFFVTTPGGTVSSSITILPNSLPAIGIGPITNPVSGVVGDQISISGFGLLGTQSVQFSRAGGGSISATSFKVVSDQQVTVTVPLGAATGPVTIVTPAGSVSTSPFVLNASLAPTISKIFPNDQVNGVTPGTFITVNGSGFLGTSSVTISGTNVNDLRVASDTQLLFRLPATASGPIVINAPGGTVTSSTSLVINAAPAPVINFSSPGAARATTININGLNLSSTTSVLFNSTPAQFQVISDNLVTAVVPQDAAPGLISVITPGGKSISPTQFSVTAAPAPQIFNTVDVTTGLPVPAVKAPDIAVVGSKFFIGGSDVPSFWSSQTSGQQLLGSKINGGVYSVQLVPVDTTGTSTSFFGTEAELTRDPVSGEVRFFTVPEVAPGRYLVRVSARTTFPSTTVDDSYRTFTSILGQTYTYGELIQVVPNATPTVSNIAVTDFDPLTFQPVPAFRGAPISILGSGFTGVNRITLTDPTTSTFVQLVNPTPGSFGFFGNNRAFTVVSDNEIRLNIPVSQLPGTGALNNVQVQVFTPAGSPLTTADDNGSNTDKTINIAASPSLSFTVAPSSSFVGPFFGTEVTLTAPVGSNFYGVSNISMSATAIDSTPAVVFLGSANAPEYFERSTARPFANFQIDPNTGGRTARAYIPTAFNPIPDPPTGATAGATVTVNATTNSGGVTGNNTIFAFRNAAIATSGVVTLHANSGFLPGGKQNDVFLYNRTVRIFGSSDVKTLTGILSATTVQFDVVGGGKISVDRENFKIGGPGVFSGSAVSDLSATDNRYFIDVLLPSGVAVTGAITIVAGTGSSPGTATTNFTPLAQPAAQLFEYQTPNRPPQNNQILANEIYQNGPLDTAGNIDQAQAAAVGAMGIDFVTSDPNPASRAYPWTFGFRRTDQTTSLYSPTGGPFRTGNHGRGGIDDGFINSFPLSVGTSTIPDLNTYNNLVGGRFYGPNLLQNFPLLQVVTSSIDRTTFSTALVAKPLRSYRIDYYYNPGFDDQAATAKNTSISPYTQTYLGSKVITTDSAGNGSVSFTIFKKFLPAGSDPNAQPTFGPGEFKLPGNEPLPVGVSSGVVVATATDLSPTGASGPSTLNGPDGTSRVSFFKRVDTTTGSITGRIIVDSNRDGIGDANEPGIAGATVQLFLDQGDGSLSSVPVDSFVTDDAGNFTFGPGTSLQGVGIPNGIHQLRVTLPSGAAFTFSSPANGILNSRILNGEALDNQNLLVVPGVPPTVPPGVPPTVPPGVPPTVPPGVPPTVPPTVPPGPGPVETISRRVIAVGADVGGGPAVSVYNPDGSVRFRFFAYDSAFTGGVRVAVGDVNGDGIGDIITAPGVGIPGVIKIFSGDTGQQLREFQPYESSFTGGIYVASADVDGDGTSDIITGTGIGGGPRVQVIRGGTFNTLMDFFAYEDTFRGGVLVSAGDVNSDGRADIVTGTGVGGGPRVRVLNGANLNTLFDFFAYEPNFRGGVFSSVGDVSGDGFADVLTGTGPGGGSLVKVFQQTDLAQGRATPSPSKSFFAYDPNFRGGVRVDVVDVSGSGAKAIATAPGPGISPDIRVIDYSTLQDLYRIQAFESAFLGGVFIGAGRTR